jgi:hypothetical protein
MTLQQSFKKIFGGLAVAGIAFSVITAQALTISPARAELTGDPGETIQGTFTLTNPLDTDQTYYTSVENFEAQGETGTPNFTASKDGLPSWVKVADKVTLKKGERVTISYNVVIPKDADSGGHFGAIFLSTVPPSAGEGQVSVGAKMGMLLFLKVTGTIKEQGGLSAFALKGDKKVMTSLPVDFIYKFKNEGNDRVKPEGELTIRNTLGMETSKIDVNKTKGDNVLPASTRRFEVRYGDVDAPALSAPFFDHVKFQKNNFALGRYTANLALTFGDKGKAESSLTFYIFPWQLLSVILGGLLAAILVLVALVKHYNRWIIKQARAAAKK